MSEKRIVRRAQGQRKTGRTDWAAVRARSEAEVARGAAADEENPPWTDAELRAANLVVPSSEARVPISIRLDPEIVRYFKAEGPGYQTRINAILLAYVRTRSAAGD